MERLKYLKLTILGKVDLIQKNFNGKDRVELEARPSVSLFFLMSFLVKIIQSSDSAQLADLGTTIFIIIVSSLFQKLLTF